MLPAATKQLPSQPAKCLTYMQVTQRSVLDVCVRQVCQAYIHAANRASRPTILSGPAQPWSLTLPLLTPALTGRAENYRGISKQAEDMS
jgi:hypothetical protein